MRRLMMRIGYRWLMALPGVWLVAFAAVWFSLRSVLDPVQLLVLSGLAASSLTLVSFLTLILGVIAGPLHESLRSTITSNISAPWALANALNSDDIPALGGWSLEPHSAAALVRVALANQPRLVLELGPGSSTDLLLRVMPPGSLIISIEHDNEWRKLLMKQLSHASEIQLEVRHAPLAPLQIDGWRGLWYDSTALDDIDHVDLLVVDGPPGPNVAMARYPALPVLADRLADDALIFIDDTSRPDEARVVKMWLERPETTLADAGMNWTLIRWQRPPSTES